MVTSSATEQCASQDTDLRERWHRERARKEITVGAIRSHLEEQPSSQSIRACARRWCADITSLADAVIKARQNQEPPE
ncbi:hypothetical protein [Streptomyces tendae]|uniref:hypothetical protein n=1 Tax=Streptomyces tendae TaxID=1932 RepID=UPI003701108B